MKIYKVSEEFTQYPEGRYKENCNGGSGEELREILSKKIKALNTHEILVIDLSGTAGYTLAFLSEVFNLLAESCSLSTEKLLEKIVITAGIPHIEYVQKAYMMIYEASSKCIADLNETIETYRKEIVEETERFCAELRDVRKRYSKRRS